MKSSIQKRVQVPNEQMKNMLIGVLFDAMRNISGAHPRPLQQHFAR